MRDHKPQTVLLVDDDPTWRLLLSISLRDAGFEVRTAATAADALNLLHVLRPTALVVDLIQPGMNGMPVLEWNAEQPRQLPTIVLIAKRTEALVSKCRSLGALHTLIKPIRAREFVAHVLDACGAPPA